MKYFIIRNSTIESLFNSKEVTYSGYGDISYIDPNADVIIWFYLLPFKTESKILSSEIFSYFNSIELLYQQVPQNKAFIVFTLKNLLSVKYQNSDFIVEYAITDFNRKVINFAAQHSNVKIIDFTDFTNKYSNEQFVDWKYYFISKMQINPKFAPAFKKWFSRKIEEIQLKRKKCIVLDLDNTLWGGILGEDGVNGIKIGGDYPGNAFLMFQEYLVELSRNGIILTVCSKNNEKEVLDAWKENPYILLKEEYISAYRINWQNKADNIKEIADELNIGLDSFIFIDDNPTERELIKQMLPMVEVPDFPEQPYMLPLFAISLIDNYFKVYTLTDEDRKKTEQYKTNSERIQAQRKYTDFKEYLKSLEINLTIELANFYNIPRIAQMTQKTNQFNLTTYRYTDTDLQGFVEKGAQIYCLSVKDRFGDNGITGCIIIKKGTTDNIVVIDTLLLSCRILGKGIEVAFVRKVLDILKSQGIEQIESYYIPTQKNIQVAEFYDKLGFTLSPDESLIKGGKKYVNNIQRKVFEIESYYKINIV